MIRRKEQIFFATVVGADIIALLSSFILAHWLRGRLLTATYGPIPTLAEYAWAMWVVVPSFIIALAGFGLYRPAAYRSAGAVVRSAIEATFVGTLMVLGVLYMMRQADLSRLVLDIFTLLCATILPAEKLVVKAMLDHAAEHQRRQKKWQVFVVGEPDGIEAYYRLLEEHPYWGVVVVGSVSPTQRVNVAAVSVGGGSAGRSVIVPIEWRELLNSYVIDEVVAVSPWSKAASFADLQEACAERGLVFRMLVTMPPPPIGHYAVDDVGTGNYLVSLETVPQDLAPLALKRAIDIAVSLVGLVLCGLVYLCYAPRLKRASPGPVLFEQQRGGHNGRIFTVYKFRTMYLDAEKRLPQLLSRNSVKGVMFKMENDPRVVPCGRSLRRTHLDELPQFWNVIKGDMSLVGPRPNPVCEVVEYGYGHHRRLSMKPGITGLFQINGHSVVRNFDDVVKLDCEYIDNWSLWLDCRIIAKTLLKVLRADGW